MYDSAQDPPLQWPLQNDAPIDEFKQEGLLSMAFPALFTDGKCDLYTPRHKNISLHAFVRHVSRWEDARVLLHPRCRYYLLNMTMRHDALKDVKAYMNAEQGGRQSTVADIEHALQNPGTAKAMSQRILRFGKNLRHTPQFYRTRREELMAMVAQLGPFHVFATHSFADTHEPTLHRVILEWHPELKGGGRDPFRRGLNTTERQKIRYKNVIDYPHVVSWWFDRTTKLYIEEILMKEYGVVDYWLRYEWQARGSVHAHYVLWFRDAPEITPLQKLVDETVEDFREAARSRKGKMDTQGCVDAINAALPHLEAAQNFTSYWGRLVSAVNKAYNGPDLPCTPKRHADHPASYMQPPDLSDLEEHPCPSLHKIFNTNNHFSGLSN